MIRLLLIIFFYPAMLAAVIFGAVFLFDAIKDRATGSYSSSSRGSGNTELLRNMMANVSPDSSSATRSGSGRSGSEEEEEKEYFDQDETYGRVPLEKLPDAFTFADDPDTVYQSYYYGTGGRGQKVRVYREGAGGRQVQISWATNGLLVGREFDTDCGKIEKYGF